VIKFTSLCVSEISFNTLNNLRKEENSAVLLFRRMEKSDSNIETAHVPGGFRRLAAAEELEQAVDRIVRALRSGKSAHLPGLGTLNPGSIWTFLPERK
jgi:hypothetical protein